MMLVCCPFCGPRAQEEFVCGGITGVQRPGPAPDVSDQQWAQYLYHRETPRGWIYERWLHAHGCGEWFNLLRNTVTQECKGPFPILTSRAEAERA